MVAAVDEVVAEQHGERLVADVSLAHEHRVAEAQRLALADEVDVAEVGRLADPREPVLVALGLERRLELAVAVEVVLEGAPCCAR